ncbi:MAG: hypothetical protein ACI9SK_000482 [Zhongshania sp.]|jgi:hypothetical protein
MRKIYIKNNNIGFVAAADRIAELDPNVIAPA